MWFCLLQYVTNEGPEFIFHTNKDAPNYRLVKINFEDYAPEKWTTLIPEHPSDVLSWATCVAKDKLVVCYIHDVKVTNCFHDLVNQRHTTYLRRRLACLPILKIEEPFLFLGVFIALGRPVSAQHFKVRSRINDWAKIY